MLVFVCFGVVVLMFGMMDIVFNLGFMDEVVEGFVVGMDNECFVYDVYWWLINMFGDVVMGVDYYEFEVVFDKIKKKYKID